MGPRKEQDCLETTWRDLLLIRKKVAIAAINDFNGQIDVQSDGWKTGDYIEESEGGTSCKEETEDRITA